MANATDFIHPIIQAMIASAQQGQAHNELKAKTAQFSEENKAKQMALKIDQQRADAEQKRIEQEHEIHKSTLENATQLLHAHLQQNKLQNIKDVREQIAAGVSPEAFRQQPTSVPEVGSTIPGTPEGQLNVPGVGNTPISAFPSLQQALENKAKETQTLSGAHTTGQMAAAEPFDIAKGQRTFENEKKRDDYLNAFKEKLQDKELATQFGIAKLHSSTQQMVNNATNATHLQIANLPYAPPTAALTPMVVAAMTGQAKLNPEHPVDRAALNAIQAAGGRPLGEKDAEQLKQMQSLNKTFDKLQDFVSTYLPDEKKSGSLGASAAAYVKGKITGTTLPTDARNKLDTIKTDAINVGKALEGLTGGRVTQQQISLMLEGMASPGKTKQQGQDLINSLKDTFINKEENVILGGIPEAQKQLIYRTYGIEPGFLKLAPKKNVLGHSLDKEESMKAGKPVYSTTQ